MDLDTAIPEYIFISDGSVHEVNTLDYLKLIPGSYLIMDRGYLDFARLRRLAQQRTNFIIRAKDNMKYRVIDQRIIDKSKGIVCDQTVLLTGNITHKKYPEKIRRLMYFDKESGKLLTFLSNNFKLSATTIADLYRNRWQIKLFFKWIKQHLKIQKFWGQNENAVKTQIWIAIATYVIVIIFKKRYKLTHSMYEILQLISISPLERTPLKELFSNENYQDVKERLYNQLKLF